MTEVENGERGVSPHVYTVELEPAWKRPEPPPQPGSPEGILKRLGFAKLDFYWEAAGDEVMDWMVQGTRIVRPLHGVPWHCRVTLQSDGEVLVDAGPEDRLVSIKEHEVSPLDVNALRSCARKLLSEKAGVHPETVS